MYLVLVFLVKLKRKNILVAKMHLCTQNVRATKEIEKTNRAHLRLFLNLVEVKFVQQT